MDEPQIFGEIKPTVDKNAKPNGCELIVENTRIQIFFDGDEPGPVGPHGGGIERYALRSLIRMLNGQSAYIESLEGRLKRLETIVDEMNTSPSFPSAEWMNQTPDVPKDFHE